MISILIPTYNYDVFTLVESLFNQCEKEGIEYEILVLDDCSNNLTIITKNTEIRKFRNVVLFRNQTNLGRTQTRKLLAKKARYNWLLFLDADVMPVATNFISQYTKVLNDKYKVIFGGYSYTEFNGDFSTILRWKYGTEREQALASERNKKPFAYVFSGNILIDKIAFLENNFDENENIYGMDIYFSYNLFQNNISVLHIDNPIIHLGLEENEIFFDKALESVKSRKAFLAGKSDIKNINPLLKHYNRLKKLRLTKVVAVLFRISEPYLKKRILSKNPNLFLFDLFRLGYICTIK